MSRSSAGLADDSLTGVEEDRSLNRVVNVSRRCSV